MPCVGGYISSSSSKVAAVAPKLLIASCDGGETLAVRRSTTFLAHTSLTTASQNFNHLNRTLIAYYYVLSNFKVRCIEFCFGGFFMYE